MTKKILLISEKQIKDNTIIEDNVDGQLLSKTIYDVQQLQLKHVLGASLYTSLCEAVYEFKTNSIQLSEQYKALLTDYVQPFLENAVAGEFLVVNNYKMTNKGVLKLKDDRADNLTAEELEGVRNLYDNRSGQYKQRLIDFLKAESLLVSEADTDTISSSIGWFLGDSGSVSYSSIPVDTTNDESDPIWQADKPNYYLKSEVNAALATKSPTGHTHSIADVTSLQTTLNGKASLSHTHAISDVTNLQTSLDGKASLSHSHSASDITSGILGTARLGSGSATVSTYLAGDSTWKTIDLSGYVPYVGATTNVNLGTRTLSSGSLSVTGTGTFASANVPLTINSTNSNVFKQAFSDNGVVRSYIGGDATYVLRIGDSSAVDRLTVDTTGNLVSAGSGSFTNGITLNKATGNTALNFNLGGVRKGVLEHTNTLRYYNDTMSIYMIEADAGGMVYLRNNVTVPGQTTTNELKINAVHGSLSAGVVSWRSAEGLVINTLNGTSNAFLLYNPTVGGYVFNVPVGTNHVNFHGDVYLNATKKLYLDGGSNTYLVESSADTISIFTGGASRGVWSSTGLSVTGSISSTTGFIVNSASNNYFRSADGNGYAAYFTGGAMQAKIYAGVNGSETLAATFDAQLNKAILPGKLKVGSVPEYADNAAAVAAGLTAGDFYRTGSIVKVVI